MLDGLPYLFRRFLADRRAKAYEADPSPILCFSRTECEAKKIKLLTLMIARAVAILAVDNFGLLGVQFQLTFPHPIRNRLAQNFRIRLGSTVYHYVICVTCLLYTSPSPRDGLLSRMPSSA